MKIRGRCVRDTSVAAFLSQYGILSIFSRRQLTLHCGGNKPRFADDRGRDL